MEFTTREASKRWEPVIVTVKSGGIISPGHVNIYLNDILVAWFENGRFRRMTVPSADRASLKQAGVKVGEEGYVEGM